MPTADDALTEERIAELARCYQEPAYFIHHYCMIYDAVAGAWVPFRLWDAQADALAQVHEHQLSIILKARQIGMTWLMLSYALWLMLFRPIASILVFSRRDTDAAYLISFDRMRGIYGRLPAWMVAGNDIVTDNVHEWSLANGSTVRAFPTTAGDSYTATLAIVDEADLPPDLNKLLRAVKPTIDNGGKMVLLSRSDKSKPVSEFKRIYREAKAGKNHWRPIFLPWWVHPGRTEEWYAAQKIEIESRTGSLDDLYEQYPATDAEAMQPRSTDKRIPAEWLAQVYFEEEGYSALGMAGLTLYRKPEGGRVYVIGCDPAEGNPNSDDSAATVLDVASGEEVAVLAGKFQPSTFAAQVIQLANFYSQAGVLVERNNHGHAVLLALNESGYLNILPGFDEKSGWHSTSKGKALLYSAVTDAIQAKDVIIHSFDTYAQLASIEGSTLRAPDNQYDDRADSFALAQVGREILMRDNVVLRSIRVAGRRGVGEERRRVIRRTSLRRQVRSRERDYEYWAI